MIIRGLLIGTILAGLTGAAVYYGLGEAGEDLRSQLKNSAQVELAAQTDTKNGDTSDVSALPDRQPMKPKNVISVKPVEAADSSDAVSGDSKATDKSSKKTLKMLLDKRGKGEAYGSGTDESKVLEPSEPSMKKTTELMKPSATGSFVVSEQPRDETQDKPSNMAMADKEAPANMMMASELETSFKDARRITNKTTRDKIYLEIFDNAVADGNMDIARRISGKLSTPELRKLARETIENASQ